MYAIERCNECKLEDHDGPQKRFCRCEMRNIWIAKKMRELGIQISDKIKDKPDFISIIDN